jgi:NO-binding membrane sensor protein with MHYT domain
MKQGDLGRQHNAAGFTIWMAGGGIRQGVRIGSTDSIGLMATDRPVQFRDLHATILTALGIDFERLSFEVSGRDERITGVAGSAQPLMDVFA